MVRISSLISKGIIVIYILTLILLTPFECFCGFKPDQVKAAFIYNLTNFVTWPQNSKLSSSKAFVICVFKNKQIAENLAIITKDEQVQGRPFVVKAIDELSEVPVCHMLVVGKDGESSFSQVFSGQNAPILTIGETERFLKKGGMVGLLKKGKKIQIVINLEAAEAVGIDFNSKLLRVAKIFGRK